MQGGENWKLAACVKNVLTYIWRQIKNYKEHKQILGYCCGVVHQGINKRR